MKFTGHNPVCVFMCVHVHMLSHAWLFAAPWTVACQTPLSMEFPRQEYWSGLLSPPPGSLPDPGIESMSLTPLALPEEFFTTRATWKALFVIIYLNLILQKIIKFGWKSFLHTNERWVLFYSPLILYVCVCVCACVRVWTHFSNVWCFATLLL